MVTHFHKEKEGRWTFAKEHNYVDVWGVASEVMSGSTASSAVTDSAMIGVLIALCDHVSSCNVMVWGCVSQNTVVYRHFGGQYAALCKATCRLC
jgi:hypothetical protein